MLSVWVFAVSMVQSTAIGRELPSPPAFRGGSDQFGCSVCSVGDVDGDGLAEFAVGDPADTANGQHSGAVFLLSQKTRKPIWVARGSKARQWFGYGLAAIGDVDADHVRDVLVESMEPWSPWGTGAGWAGQTDPPGAVFVLSGRTGNVLHEIPKSFKLREFGHAIAGMSDIDKDGVSDFLIGTRGSASVYSGATGAAVLTLRAPPSEGVLGFQVADAGDQNGDGTADIAVSAPFVNFANDSGLSRAHLYDAVSGELLRVIALDSKCPALGGSMCSAGDIDGDGWMDFVLGTTVDPDHESDCRDVCAVSSRTGRTLWSFQPVIGALRRETILVDVDDLDGDRCRDVLLGSFELAAPAGRVFAISSRTGRELYSLRLDGHPYLGVSGASGADLDGDGTADLLIGSCNPRESTAKSGQVLVVSGRSGKLLDVRTKP